MNAAKLSPQLRGVRDLSHRLGLIGDRDRPTVDGGQGGQGGVLHVAHTHYTTIDRRDAPARIQL